MLRAIFVGKSQPGSGLGEFYRSIHYRDSTFANRPRLKRKTECARAGRRSRGGFGQREMALKGVRAGNSSPMVRNPPVTNSVAIRADDHLVHQPIGAGRQTISHARVHIEVGLKSTTADDPNRLRSD